MKARIFAALAFLLFCGPAFAQWQTPNHSVPLGRGSGVTGFSSAVPGTAGQPLVSQGATADPAFGTIANSGFTPGAANTAKGSLNGTTTVDLPLPSCTGVNQAWKYVSGTGINCSAVSTTGGYDAPINLGLSVPAPSGNALVITLTQANGSAPSASSPVIAPFRSTAGTTGTVTFASITATQSITIPNGATLGTLNGVAFRVWIFLEYDGGTPELAVATCSAPGTVYSCAAWESTLPTSTTISGSSNTGGTLYSTTGVTADSVRIIGYCEFGTGLTTAGAWASACTNLQVFGPGIAKPGEVIQTVNSAAITAQTLLQTAETQTAVTAAITPSSPASLIRVTCVCNLLTGAAFQSSLQISRGTLPTLFDIPFISGNAGSGNFWSQQHFVSWDLPPVGTTTPINYYLFGKCTTNNDCIVNYTGGSNAPSSKMTIEEIQP